MRALLSNKQGIHETVEEFDAKDKYNYKSTDFEFETFIFDLEKGHFT